MTQTRRAREECTVAVTPAPTDWEWTDGSAGTEAAPAGNSTDGDASATRRLWRWLSGEAAGDDATAAQAALAEALQAEATYAKYECLSQETEDTNPFGTDPVFIQQSKLYNPRAARRPKNFYSEVTTMPSGRVVGGGAAARAFAGDYNLKTNLPFGFRHHALAGGFGSIRGAKR